MKSAAADGNTNHNNNNENNNNNKNNDGFKSVQDIDDYIINPKEITDLIDSDPSVLKEIEKLKEESKKVASEAIEKLKTSNENELRETFQKTTERVVSAQSEAESAAMDELASFLRLRIASCALDGPWCDALRVWCVMLEVST